MVRYLILLLCIFITRGDFCHKEIPILQREHMLENPNMLSRTQYLGHYRTQILTAADGHRGAEFHALIKLAPHLDTSSVKIHYYDCWVEVWGSGMDLTNCLQAVKDNTLGNSINISPPWTSTNTDHSASEKGANTNIWDFKYTANQNTNPKTPHNHIISKVEVDTGHGTQYFYEESYLCPAGQVPATGTTGAACVICANSVLGQPSCPQTRRLFSQTTPLSSGCTKRTLMYGNLYRMGDNGECYLDCVDVTGLHSPVRNDIPTLSKRAPGICEQIKTNGLYYYTKECQVLQFA